jgi:acyl dehydratase
MHSLTAKPLGFPGAIAHGMWTKARALAQLESELLDSFEVDVRFRKPILLPARVVFAEQKAGEGILLAVRDAENGTPHLDGRISETKSSSKPAKTTGRKKAK